MIEYHATFRSLHYLISCHAIPPLADMRYDRFSRRAIRFSETTASAVSGKHEERTTQWRG